MRLGVRLFGAGLLCAIGCAVGVGVAPGKTLGLRASSATYAATVTRVIDGDTIDARLASGRKERVRLIGIDTPERGTCYAAEATSAATSLALGKRVKLVTDPTQARRDRYDRLLAYVVLPGGVDLARTLIARGFGPVYIYDRPFVRLSSYRQAQSAAIAAKAGIWSACASSASPPPAGTTTRTSGGRCDPSYPTVCIPPPPPDLDCKDVPYRDFVVRAPDPHRFDGDHDGRGCE